MSSPVHEKDQYSFPAFQADQSSNPLRERRSSDEDGTLQEEGLDDGIDPNYLRVTTSYAQGQDHIYKDGRGPSMSPAAQRAQSRRLDDELEMLRAERVATNAERSQQGSSMGRSKSVMRSRSRTAAEPADDFDIDTTPIHEKTKIYSPPANPTTKFAKFFKTIHNSSFLVRYFCYISPVTILLLIPLLLGLLVFKQTTVGDVELFWFGIWLEIIWLTLWAGRVSAKSVG